MTTTREQRIDRADLWINAIAAAVIWPLALFVVVTETWDAHGLVNRLVVLLASFVPLPALLSRRGSR